MKLNLFSTAIALLAEMTGAGTPTAVFQNLSTPQWTLPTYGLYYQWGRKDPSPRPPSYDFDMQSMETIPFFGPNGEPVNYISEFSSDENTIEDSARNPLLLMDQNIQGPNYAYDWLYYEIDQLWGGKSMKTIYDPCPYGYKVPYDELETLFKAASYYYNNYIYFEGRVIGLGIRPGVLGSREEIFFPFKRKQMTRHGDMAAGTKSECAA